MIIFDSSGAFIRECNGEGSAGGRLDGPIGIAVIPNGSAVYITERDADRVRVFDSFGNQLHSWGGAGSGEGQFRTPSGLALDADANVYVVDVENTRIQRSAHDDTFVTAWSFGDYGNTSWPSLYDVLIDGETL